MNWIKFKSNGFYLYHSAVACVDASLDDCMTAVNDYTTTTEYGWVFRKDIAVNFDAVQPLLVREHERYHHIQFFSTPFGLFVWRLTNSVLSAVQWLVRSIGLNESLVIDQSPLIEWFDRRGKDAIERNDAISPLRKAYMLTLFDDLRSVTAFLEALLERPELSIEQFLHLAREATAVIQRASDLSEPFEWYSGRDPATVCYEPGIFSVTEIVEAGARLHEMRLLSGASNSVELISHWRKRSIFGVYKPAFEWLQSELGDPVLESLAIDLALLSPVDPVTSSVVQGRACLEDTHPGWRLRRIVQAMQSNFLNESLGYEKFVQDVLSHAGLTQTREIADAMLRRTMNGPMSWIADERLRDRKPVYSLEPAFKFFEDELRYHITFRLEHPIAISGFSEGQPRPHLFRVPLEIYRDRAWTGDTPVSHDRSGLFLNLYHLTVLGFILLSFLEDNQVPAELFTIERSFRNMLIDEESEETRRIIGSMLEMFSVRRIADSSLGRAAHFLHWPSCTET